MLKVNDVVKSILERRRYQTFRIVTVLNSTYLLVDMDGNVDTHQTSKHNVILDKDYYRRLKLEKIVNRIYTKQV